DHPNPHPSPSPPHSRAFHALHRWRVGVLCQHRGLRVLGSNPSCVVAAMSSPSEAVPFPNPEETWAMLTVTEKDLEQMVYDQVCWRRMSSGGTPHLVSNSPLL